MNASKLQPALFGGLFTGVLSALPFISAGNCLCCLWVICGGALAAYLLQQNQPHPIEAGDGAIVGVLSGLVGAVVASALAIPLQMLMGPIGADFFRGLAESASDMPPEIQSLFDQMSTTGFGVAAMLIGLVVNLVLFSVFGLVGGLLGHAIFRKVQPPPQTPAFLDPTAPTRGV